MPLYLGCQTEDPLNELKNNSIAESPNDPRERKKKITHAPTGLSKRGRTTEPTMEDVPPDDDGETSQNAQNMITWVAKKSPSKWLPELRADVHLPA